MVTVTNTKTKIVEQHNDIHRQSAIRRQTKRF